jgi:hypothetical protein
MLIAPSDYRQVIDALEIRYLLHTASHNSKSNHTQLFKSRSTFLLLLFVVTDHARWATNRNRVFGRPLSSTRR